MARILVTSALPYVNNIPHLGNLIGAVLSADVYARHQRLAGNEVLYVCGADDHGTATETKAREEGLTPKQLCDKYGIIHEEIYDWFEISFDVWGRTHTETQDTIVQEIFTRLDENGYINEQEVEQLYDEKAKSFLADRFVEGTCPYCGSPGARGDQCDNCGRLINAVELKDPVSKLTGTRPVIKRTKHLFLDLPALKGDVEEYLKSTELTENAKKTTDQWLSVLKERAITRDLSWGVPVPKKGWEDKVFYVWFDAPIGYISITAHSRTDWRDWWHGDATLVQFMGKDNIVFHTVIFPATLLGTKDKWTMMHALSSTEFLNMEGGKFSKSRKIGVFGDDAIAIHKEYGITADAWRYYLLSIRPETADTNFIWKDFQARVNNELIANYANLVNRATHFASTKLAEEPATLKKPQADFLDTIKQHAERARAHLDARELREALQETMLASKEANAYFQHSAPWKTITEDKETAAADVFALLHAVRDLSILLLPYIPAAAAMALDQLGLRQQTYADIGKPLHKNVFGHVKPGILFQKIEDDTIGALEKAYGPKEAALDLRVAKILAVKAHPNADKLLVLDIDLGKERRQLVAGLKKHYKPEELVGTSIIVVANLEHANLRGEKSEGMLLAAEKDGVVGLLRPDAKPGTRLTIGGRPGSPEKLSFNDFTTHTLSATKDGFTVDDEPVEGAPISVDRQAHGPVH